MNNMINPTFEEIFTYDHLMTSARKCLKGVRWKASVQRFEMNLVENVLSIKDSLLSGTFKSDGFYVFSKIERVKLRVIHSVSIRERVVQKCLCNYYLFPLLHPTFIYDNGASQKGKGISFTLKRLKCHIQKFNKEYQGEGYFLKFDFSKYFESINHTILKNQLEKYLKDEKLKKLVFYFIDCFDGEVGLGLGSEVSQVLALFYASKLDHFIKEKLHIKYYGRYMDDGYLIHRDKEYLKHCLEEIKKVCDELKLTLNKNKTQIIKFSRGINILKKSIKIKDNTVIMKIDNDILVRMRRKIKTIPKEELQVVVKSWDGSVIHFNNYKSYQHILKLAKEKINNSYNIEESEV